MIFYVFGKPDVRVEKTGTNLFFESLGMKYEIHADELVTYVNDSETASKELIYAGQRWLQVCRLNDGLYLSDAQDGNIYVADEAGNALDFAPEIVYLLRYALPGDLFDQYVIGQIDDYEDAERSSLFLGNVDNNKFICRKNFTLQNIALETDGIYGFHFWTDSLKKLDFELNDVWTFDPGAERFAPMQTVSYKDTILYYHGFVQSEVLEKFPVPGEEELVYNHGVRRNGELYCLDRDTGDKRWERVFPYALNDMVLHDDKLYCVAENELFRLSPDTGEIEHQTQMEYSAGGDTELYKVLTIIENKLWIQINHWYFKNHCLLVVDLDTFAVEHRIDIPAPYQPERFLFFDEKSRQVYYRLHFRYAETRIEHNHPLLALSLDELDQPLALEPRPDIDISFKPANDNKELEELWIHIKDTPLHKAIRFGIIESQNQTNVHAEMNRHGESCLKTFNGRVHFRYSGSDKSKNVIEESLKVVENSFNDWARRMGVEAGTGSGEPVSIDVA